MFLFFTALKVFDFVFNYVLYIFEITPESLFFNLSLALIEKLKHIFKEFYFVNSADAMQFVGDILGITY